MSNSYNQLKNEKNKYSQIKNKFTSIESEWKNLKNELTALINKIPTKDRIINALQIYSTLDLNSPYSDLTLNSINQLENEITKINVNDIKFDIPYKKRLPVSPYKIVKSMLELFTSV